MLELAVPHVRQKYDYDCGPACLTAVLRYLGQEAEIEDLIPRSRCSTKDGTRPIGIIKAASDFAVVPILIENMSLEGLGSVVADGHAVILLIQAWAQGGRPKDGYSNRFDDGHYVVATAMRERSILCMDPSLDVPRGSMTLRELQSRWHDVDTIGDTDQRELFSAGIVFPLAAANGRRRRLRRTGVAKIL